MENKMIYITINLVSIILTILFICKLIKREKNIRIILKKYIDGSIRCIVPLTYIVLIYILIKTIGLKVEFNEINKYKDCLLFIFVVIIIIEIEFMYKKSAVKYLESILIYLIWGVAIYLFIEYLSTNILFNRWLFCLIQLINLKVIIDLDKEYYKLEKNNNKINEQICSYYEELFPTRRNQADSIIRYIDSYNDNDRFTLLLNGSWGEGKTSLVKGIEDKCKNKYNMIFIQPMMFDKRDLLIKYFFERLKEILREKKIYTGKGSNVERYFMSLLNWVNKKSTVGFVDNIINKETNDFRKIKEELQLDIEKYVENKRIIVVVDDFDRVEVETIKEVLMFIREIIDFEGINIVLLMEYSKIINNSMDNTYLQKYIDFRINLNRVDINEIVETFLGLAINSDENYSDLEDEKSSLIKNVKYVFVQLEKVCEEKIERLNKEDRNEEKDKYIEIKKAIKSNLNNIRLIKKIIREFVKAYYELYVRASEQKREGENSKIEFDNDDTKCILKIIIVKNMFIDEYEEIAKLESMYNYLNPIYPRNSENSYIISLFNEIGGYIKSIKIINRYKMLDAIIKNEFDNIEYQTLTKNEFILNELDNYDVSTNKYLWCFEKYDEVNENFNGLYSIIWNDYCEKGNRNKTKKRIKKIEDLFLKHIENYDEKQGINLLGTYYNITSIFERAELSYGFITKIYKLIKAESYSQKELKIIKINVSNIRENNLNKLSHFIDVVLRLDDANEKFAGRVHVDLNDFNKDLIKSLEENVEVYKNESIEDTFDILLEKVKNEIKKIEENSDINKNYIYSSITKFQIIEKIISRIESKVPCVTEQNMDLRMYIESCSDCREFRRVALDTIEYILRSNEFDNNHLNICYGILNGLKKFKDREIINLMDNVIKKANKNKYPHRYTMLQLQNLIIYKEEVKKNIYSGINN